MQKRDPTHYFLNYGSGNDAMRRRWLVAVSSTIMAAASPPAAAPSDETEPRHATWTASFCHSPASSADLPDRDVTIVEARVTHRLHAALKRHRDMSDSLVRQLSVAHEVASRTEALLFPHLTEAGDTAGGSFLSQRLEEKIATSARLLEQNAFALERLLRPFPVASLPNATNSSSGSRFTFPPSDEGGGRSPAPGPPTRSIARYIPPHRPGGSDADDAEEGDDESYDSASHVLAHLARDWTASGAPIRSETHDWIVAQLLDRHRRREQPARAGEASPLSPVLVPGAGMARLAFDIALARDDDSDDDEDGPSPRRYPFAVEANDNSPVMAAAAYHLLHRCANRTRHGPGDDDASESTVTVYPMASDPFANEEDSTRRWEPATFPEERVSRRLRRLRARPPSSLPSLSYVVGDFAERYAAPSRRGAYGAVATCFFLDTAANVYEHVVTIRHLLRAGGVWINLGPLHWHRSAALQPTAEELRDVVLLAGFRIDRWEVADKLVAYRHPDDVRRGTRAEAYRPLRFVAVLPDEQAPVAGDPESGGDDLLGALDALRRTTGRKPMTEGGKDR